MPQNLFKIYDGRTNFWQWDTGQKLIVLDDTVDQVHFSTKDMTHALVTEVRTNDDGIRVCNIPDIILTLPKNLVAYAYILDSNKTRTVRSVKFPVIPRPIPDNYISNINDEIEDIMNRVVLLESMFSDVEFKQFDTLEEAERWAKESQESGIVIAVKVDSKWVAHMIEDDYSVVPIGDWNTLLNKPFDCVTDVILDECTIECVNSTYKYVNGAKTVVIGDTYTVIFDGVRYECECLSPKGFGNKYLADSAAENTGEPFFLRYDGMVNGYVLFVEELGNHTIAIEKQVIECIDEKYIPDTIARVSSLVGKDLNGTTVYPTSDSDGVIAAVGAEIFNDYAERTYTDNGTKVYASAGNVAVYAYSHAEGNATTASAYASHAEGNGTMASGPMAHAEGSSTIASSDSTHAEGARTVASGSASHAEGRDTQATGSMSHSEGLSTIASGEYSHAEGVYTEAIGIQSHAEGVYTYAQSQGSHTQGRFSIKEPYIEKADSPVYGTKSQSYMDGYYVADSYTFDSTTGNFTLIDAVNNGELPPDVAGKYFIENSDVGPIMFKFTSISSASSYNVKGNFIKYWSKLEREYAHVVGNGADMNTPSNAHTIDWDGNAWFAGGVKVGGTSQDDTEAKELATKEYVDAIVAALRPKKTTISLLAANWVGDAHPYSQEVTISGVTENSMVDLQPTAVQIVELQDAEITLMLQNDAGVVTAWAIGNKPTTDYKMQALITEVTVI